MESANVFTFKQFMEATSHLDVPVTEKLDGASIPAPTTEAKICLVGNGESRYFYTKSQAKDYAQEQTETALKWFKKGDVVYAKNEAGERVWEILK